MNNTHTITAIVVLGTGVALSYIDYFLPPQGEIASSVLDYLTHTMMFAGSIFGVKSYIDHRLNPNK